MAANRKEAATVVVAADEIRAEFRALKTQQPAKHQADVQDRIEKFNEYKRVKPPRQLPRDMKDHKLGDDLSEYSECHLAGDILLIYQHEEDVVYMLAVCQHGDLYKRGFKQQLKRRKSGAQAKLAAARRNR